MRLGPTSTIAIATAWLATLAVAFLVGRERATPHRASLQVLAGPRGANIETTHPISGDYRLNETRRIGNQNRFVTYTQTLDGDELARILPEITDKMTLEQIHSTRERLFAEVPPGPTRRIARFELFRRWAQLDPGQTFEHIAALDDPKMRHDLRLKSIEGWASVAPAAALAFALETDPELLTKSKDAVRAGFAATRDLDAAFKFIPTLASEKNPDKDWSVSMATEALFHNDDLAVTNWVENLEPGPVREEAMTGIVRQWAFHDPEAAAEWVEEHSDSDHLDENRKLIQSIAAQSR